MGILSAVNLNGLIALDAGGLTKALQQIMEAMQDHQEKIDTQQQEIDQQKQQLQDQHERLDAFDEMFGDGKEEDATAPADDAPAGPRGSVAGAMHVIHDLSTAVESLTARLTSSEQQHSTTAQRLEQASQMRSELEKRLAEEDHKRQALEDSLRALESAFRLEAEKSAEDHRGIESLRQELADDLRMKYQQFEARVRAAEDKASACREDAKAFRESGDNSEYALSEMQSQVRRLKNRQDTNVMEAHSNHEVDHLSHNIQVQMNELEERIRAKASESVVEAIRSDLEMNSRVLQDAVKAMGQRLSGHEDRIRGVENAPVQRSLITDADFREQRQPSPKARSSSQEPTHCLLCYNDRSLSPSRTIIGTDNQVYSHVCNHTPAEMFGECISDPHTLSSLRGSPSTLQNFVRPRPTPASIPTRPQSAPHYGRLHPEVASGQTTAAAVSSLQKSVKRPGSDVKSRRIGDLVAVPNNAVGGRSLSRPSSAQSFNRPTSAGALRPSSAGHVRTAGAANFSISIDGASPSTFVDASQQSLLTVDKRNDSQIDI